VGVTGWDSRGATLLLATLLLVTLSLSRLSCWKDCCWDRGVLPVAGDGLYLLVLLLLVVLLVGREGVKLVLLGLL
jgi:hypothetical protein